MAQTNAERQKAYRDRRAQEEGREPREPSPPRSTPPPSSLPDLEGYVADAVFMAELHHSQASPGATESVKSLAEGIERAESYARWRYAGVLEGSVNGL